MVTDAEISGKIITLCLKTCHRKSREIYKKVSIKSKFLWYHTACITGNINERKRNRER